MRSYEFIKESEEIVQEIHRLGAGGYTGGKKELKYRKVTAPTKPLPGGSGLLYSIVDDRGEYIIQIFDPKAAGDNQKPVQQRRESDWDFNSRLKAWEYEQEHGLSLGPMIARLEVATPDTDLPLKGAVQVNTITVDEDYRGYGLAKALYGIVLTIMKRPLVAGDAQTPGGRRNWVSLSQIPGVEMKGYFSIEDWETKEEENIDTIMGELGGQYIGQKHGNHYFAFDVQPNTTAEELEAYVKTNLSQVYPKYHDNEAGLFAIWTGQ